MFPLHFIAIFSKFVSTLYLDHFCQRTDVELKCRICDDIVNNFGKTKPETAKRNDQNVTTVMTETKPLQWSIDRDEWMIKSWLYLRYSLAFKDSTYQGRQMKLDFFHHASSWNFYLTHM